MKFIAWVLSQLFKRPGNTKRDSTKEVEKFDKKKKL